MTGNLPESLNESERRPLGRFLTLNRANTQPLEIKSKENIKKIDDIILSKLKNWSLDRIAKIDLAILRLAIYEILYVDSIPNKVSANEAVELAKTYGNNDSKSFVNGVIAKVIEDKEEENGRKENI